MTARTGTVGVATHTFPDLRTLLAKASPHRSGDVLAGVAAESAVQRVAARRALADVALQAFLDEPVVPYETDDVTRLILDSHDAAGFAPLASLTVGGLRDLLLDDGTQAPQLTAMARALTPEMVAGVSKLMRTQDLIAVAARARVVTGFRTTLGLPGRLASRLQPNSATDDPREVLASTLDGLLLGCGDAVVGINPATDSPQAAIERAQTRWKRSMSCWKPATSPSPRVGRVARTAAR